MISTALRSARLVAVLVLLAISPVAALSQQAVQPAGTTAQESRSDTDFGKLFDAVVETTVKNFWDKERLAEVGWEKRAAEVRQSVVEAPDLDEAARRINALLGELKMSHTTFLTPDDVDYYILLAVFNGAGMPRQNFDDRFWGTGIVYPGIGHFSVRIGGRDFVDAILEGSPAARAGLKVGDELVSVDGAPHHQIRSFRGKAGRHAAVAIRRVADGPVETLDVPVRLIAPLHALREATQASTRIIERNGARVAYVHVWQTLDAAPLQLALGIVRPDARPPDGLVVDMRGKIGGRAEVATGYLELIDRRGPNMRAPGRRNRIDSFRGHTAVLIDHHTRSAGELFVHSYRRERQGPLIGTRTAGAVSGGGAYIMPGNNLLYLATRGLEIDGEVLEGVGVRPDIEVARPIPYSNGADPVLDAAVDHLATRANAVKGGGPAGKGIGQ